MSTEKSAFDKMLFMQKTFQQRLYGENWISNERERTQYIMQQINYMNNEVAEMLYELPFFKDWKDYSQMDEVALDTAVDNARKEFVDVWHFVMNIMNALDISADDLYIMYMAKINENHRRQDEGYDHTKSYHINSYYEANGKQKLIP